MTAPIASNAAPDLEAPDLQRLDDSVDAAIRAGEAGPLRVLGYGEITLVLGWPAERPELAVKRLPAFRDREALDRYAALLGRYLGALEERGVTIVPTVLRSKPTARGARHAYLIQPLIGRARLLDYMLRSARAERGAVLLERLVDAVVRTVDDRIGLDAQAANWVVTGNELACLDVSTPLMRSSAGRSELELEPFLSIYPAALRRLLAQVARTVMRQYHEPRTVLVDVGSNLVKEELESWLPAFLAAANAHVRPAITESEVQRYFARDRRLWLLMQRLRRIDRAWQRRVRRRPYPFLLAPPYHYGPPERHDEL